MEIVSTSEPEPPTSNSNLKPGSGKSMSKKTSVSSRDDFGVVDKDGKGISRFWKKKKSTSEQGSVDDSSPQSANSSYISNATGAGLSRKHSGSGIMLNLQADFIEETERPKRKTWKEAVPSNHLDTLTRSETKKQQVIWELYVTESGYVKDLKMVRDIFMRPLSDCKIINQKTFELVFGNLEGILLNNYEFFKGLTKLYETSPILDNFGEFFIKFVSR